MCNSTKWRQNTNKYKQKCEQNKKEADERARILLQYRQLPAKKFPAIIRRIFGISRGTVVQKNFYIHILQIPAENSFQNTDLRKKEFYLTTLFTLLLLQSVLLTKYEYGAFIEWSLEGELKNSRNILS
jgi:hypothetical protein